MANRLATLACQVCARAVVPADLKVNYIELLDIQAACGIVTVSLLRTNTPRAALAHGELHVMDDYERYRNFSV